MEMIKTAELLGPDKLDIGVYLLDLLEQLIKRPAFSMWISENTEKCTPLPGEITHLLNSPVMKQS